MPYIVSDPLATISIPDAQLRELTDGIWEIHLTRDSWGTEPIIDRYAIGRVLEEGPVVLKIIDCRADQNDLYLKVVVLTGAIWMIPLLQAVIAVGLFALVGWTVHSITKIADAAGTYEIVEDPKTGKKTITKKGFVDSLADLFGQVKWVLIIGLGVWGLSKLKRHE